VIDLKAHWALAHQPFVDIWRMLSAERKQKRFRGDSCQR